MVKYFITLILVLTLAETKAQPSVTTFILVRHAEKDMAQSTNDPDLSDEGKKRAERLSEVLKETNVTAVYSTTYKRTHQTVGKLSNDKGLKVQSYSANQEQDIVNMFNQNKGGTIVISGHSNTVPWTVNFLIGEKKYQNLDDTEYDNLIVVSVIELGKTAKVTWLKY